jgi:hypothetical protein
MQHDSPGAEKETNWLPTPSGPFRPVLRAYQPGPAILDGAYHFPGSRGPPEWGHYRAAEIPLHLRDALAADDVGMPARAYL